jgi:hypothetical protein
MSLIPVLIFIVLPVALVIVAWRVRPAVDQSEKLGDPYGANLVARGLFEKQESRNGVQNREEGEPVAYSFGTLKRRRR